jgi:hypothetical protein
VRSCGGGGRGGDKGVEEVAGIDEGSVVETEAEEEEEKEEEEERAEKELEEEGIQEKVERLEEGRMTGTEDEEGLKIVVVVEGIFINKEDEEDEEEQDEEE